MQLLSYSKISPKFHFWLTMLESSWSFKNLWNSVMLTMLVLTFATKKKDGSRQKTVQLSLEVRLQKQDLQTVKN